MPGHVRYDRQTLVADLDGHEPLRFVFFWGHRTSRPGEVTKACFSQWWPSAFHSDGTQYLTAEHWMMAEKARLFGDEETRDKVLAAPSPGAAKALGREIASFDQGTWDAAKYDIVVAGNLLKFSQNPDLGAFLAGTGTRILVEASPVDPVWGIGLEENDPAATRPDLWKGENLLGFALMSVRDLLAAQA